LTKKTLGLYQFIPNHRPFQRSYHPLLVGKTPAEALTGKPHPHWLELLGYQRFQSAELAAKPLSLNARRMPNGRNHSLAYYFFRIPRSPHIDLRTIGVKGVLKYPTRSGPVV
jgi:hypothetical protein